MHAGEGGDSRGQRANGGKIPAGRFETPKPEEKWEEKCTPVRRGKAEASVHTEVKSTPAGSLPIYAEDDPFSDSPLYFP